MLDIVGVGWPNVDEDAYRDMATALREFAEDADDDGHAAHQHIQRLLSTGQSESLTALDKHWSKVQGKHADLAKAARLVADALDRVADIIVARKIAAVGELADLCATVGITLAFAPVTAGLSTLLAGAKIAATRIAFKKILKEMAEAAVAEIVAVLTQPAVAAIENVVADLAIQTALNVTGVQDGYNTGQTVQAGKDGLQINSAGGAGGGRGGGPVIDHDAHGKAGGNLTDVQIAMQGKTRGKLGKAKSHHGRAKGKDSLTAVLDTTIEGVTEKLGKALDDLGDHIGKKLPDAIRGGSKTHRDTDQGVHDDAKRVKSPTGKDDGGLDGQRGKSGPAGRRGNDQKPPRLNADSLGKAKNNPRLAGASQNSKPWCNDPVDAASGEMYLPQTDLTLPSVLPLELSRTHLSGYRFGHWFGRSWASTLDERLQLEGDGSALWAREDGTVLLYGRLPQAVGDEVWPQEGPRLPLVRLEADDGAPPAFAVRDPRTRVLRRFTAAEPPTSVFDPVVVCWLEEIGDLNGNAIEIVRDCDGVPAAVVHSGGYEVRIDTAPLRGDDGPRRVTGLSLVTADGPVRVLAFGYDLAGNVDAVTNSTGVPLRFAYDEDARIVSWTDRNNSTFRYVYDERGRVVETAGPQGYMSGRFTYDTERRVTRYTDSTGATTVFHLNELSQVVALTDPAGHTVQQTWDRFDHLLSRTDALGGTTHFRYDDAGNLVSVELPDGSRSTAEYNDLNLPVRVTGPDGAQWVQEWDERGNRTRVTEPDGATTLFTYDAHGAVASVTDPLGAVQTLVNNAAGLVVSVTDPLGARHHIAYDSFGRTASISDPMGGTTHLTWTVEGQLKSRVEPDGTGEEWTYDDEGNCLTHTDALGQVTRFTYTDFDLLTSRVSADGARHTFTYDTELRLTRVTDPQGRTWDYVYDACGAVVSESDFDGRTVHYRYDAEGRLVGRTNSMGQTIEYAYDRIGNQIRKTVDGTTTLFEHDEAGRLTRAVSPMVTLTYAYDRAGRITGESVDGRTLTSRYDDAGRPVLRVTPAGVTSAYRYDAAGNRTAIESSGRTLSFSYDATGRETARHLAPGTVLTHSWDVSGRLTGQSLGAALSRSYTYRADGLLTAVSGPNTGRRTFDLDPVGRVTGIHASQWNESYAYDDAGRQTHAEWPDGQPSSEARGEREYTGTLLRRAGSVHYEYDAAGRVVLRRKTRLSRKPDVWRYSWDAEDHLTEVITPDGTRWRYLYDPLGRRVAKQRLAPDERTVAEETRFVWDGAHLVEQTTHTVGTSEDITLTWDRDGAHPVSQTESKSRVDDTEDPLDQRFYSIVTDLVGTPTELVDPSGEIACRMRSTLWGVTTWNRDASAYTPLRFPGQYFDVETQLHYNVFRHYDPATGLYTSPDPLGLDAGPDPHRYVLNPLHAFDYFGLQQLTCKENAKLLRENMTREGRAPSAGQAAAHLVPSGGSRRQWAPGARSRALLEKYHVNINDAANGVGLTHPKPHNYTHRGAFLTRLDQHLQSLVRDMQAEGRGTRAIRSALRSELRAIGKEVVEELKSGKPGQGAVWTA
ncbi:DUF6531 domain-containing protein [Streptomyces sp. NPDC045431]|uniref:DUF6531 domain-containing protein n=1 Tax=Streptomyces sp. NPDC045431 TaxID=3155613 RepID=UPI0033FDD9FC